MVSDMFYMVHRYIWDECGTQSSDRIKLDAESLCTGLGLKSGV